MKTLKPAFALVLLTGTVTTGWARPPLRAPENPIPQVALQEPYSPIPTPLQSPPNLGVPPAIPPQPPVTGGAIIQSPQMMPGQIQMMPGQMMMPQPMMVMPPAPQQPGIILDPGMVMPVALYTNVKVIEPRNMAPCAVPKIVSVPDPCNPGCCVFISICVPACACEDVFYRPLLDRTVFDYGKYRVKVTNRRGTLVVNYDD